MQLTTNSHRALKPTLPQVLCLSGLFILLNVLSRSSITKKQSDLPNVASKGSVLSVYSMLSFGSFGSILSIGSAGSILSVGSTGSILSIGSAGSILSFGSAGSILSVGSAGSILSINGRGSILNIASENVEKNSIRLVKPDEKSRHKK